MAWSKAFEKFIEVVDNQLSRFSNASLILRDAKARSEALRALAHAEGDAARLLAQAEADSVSVKKGDLKIIDATNMTAKPEVKALNQETKVEELATEQRVLARVVHQETVKDNNIQKVVAYAAQEIEDSPTEKVSETDEELVARIFAEAQFVSKEDMQKLWGKLLANTIIRPESCSVELVEFLKRLTNKRAQEIALMGSLVFLNSIVKVEKVNSLGLDYWLKMENLGIVTGVQSIGLERQHKSLSSKTFHGTFVTGSKVLIVEGDDPQQQLKLPVYLLTDLGKQVVTLGSFDSDNDYVDQIGQLIKKRGFKVSKAEVEKMLQDGVVQYKNRTDL